MKSSQNSWGCDVAGDAAAAQAVFAALAHFEAVSGETTHAGHSRVIGTEADGSLIVRVCHGTTRPLRRVWYRVALGGEVLAELSFADVARFGERPWR